MGRVYINIDCKVSPLFRLFFKISSREKEPDTSKSQVKPIKIYKDSLYQKFDEEDSHPRTPRHEKKISTPGNTPTRSPTIRGEKVDGQHLWE